MFRHYCLYFLNTFKSSFDALVRRISQVSGGIVGTQLNNTLENGQFGVKRCFAQMLTQRCEDKSPAIPCFLDVFCTKPTYNKLD